MKLLRTNLSPSPAICEHFFSANTRYSLQCGIGPFKKMCAPSKNGFSININAIVSNQLQLVYTVTQSKTNHPKPARLGVSNRLRVANAKFSFQFQVLPSLYPISFNLDRSKSDFWLVYLYSAFNLPALSKFSVQHSNVMIHLNVAMYMRRSVFHRCYRIN